jgi:S-layer homology domain/Cytochrome c7 and related cytochrome c
MTRRKRTTMIVLLTVVALLIIAGVAWAAGVFPDVDPSDTHAADIQWAADNGVVNGYANGNFGPYDPILRGQAATMFKNYDDFAKSTSSGGTTNCKECHNDTTVLTGKAAAWRFSLHGTGEVFLEDGGNKSCAGCHSGGTFSSMVAAGLEPNALPAGDPNPTPQDCRACHKIHTSYTGADWALETTAPVAFYALPGKTFDGGAGNLCAKCHQPRTAFPAAVDGKVTITSTRFGPHHGPQSAMLLGVGGADATGTPMFHYTAVADTCITCHMGPITDEPEDDDHAGEAAERPNAGHTFEPNVATCATCHAGATSFDINGEQTAVDAKLDELKAALTTAGLLNATGGVVLGTYPEAQAAALWNYGYIRTEDKSRGVHNPAYVMALLDAGLAAF